LKSRSRPRHLERSAYHAPSGTFYTVIPVSRADTAKACWAQTDPKSRKLVKLTEIEGCHPHSLSIVYRGRCCSL